MLRIYLLCMLLIHWTIACGYTVGIHISELERGKPIVWHAVQDVQQLLYKAGVDSVVINRSGAINLFLPDIREQKLADVVFKNYPTMIVPERSYRWDNEISGNKYLLKLSASSDEGISAGLYGLLQDLLGFNFYHPRETVIPNLKKWPLTQALTYASTPRFNKMGFHLHTMHPIELTEALLDENFPDGEKRIVEYINWLARNRQNYLEFNLLETINLARWPQYAEKWVQYMKDRGVIPGIDLSLNMKQQAAFKLYRNPPKSFRSKKKQIVDRVSKLQKIGFELWNMEFSSTEFSSGNVHKKNDLRDFILAFLHADGVHLTGRQHVVKPEKMVRSTLTSISSARDTLDAYRGTMIHTVMFYTLNDSVAPIYGNKNLLHMRALLLAEQQHRETWYYPESAYWVTFDNSIPLYLTSYLRARLEDILYCDSLSVEGHLTFSSGWEWSYWLTDWSIANWSWKMTLDGVDVKPYPEQYFDKLIPQKSVRDFFKKASELQDLYIKKQNLIRYLTAATVTDEMPLGKNLPLQPMPERSYAYLRNKASQQVIDSIRRHVLPLMEDYHLVYQKIRDEIKDLEIEATPILNEIVESLDMVDLRVRHREATLKYLLAMRESELKKDKREKRTASLYLDQAQKIREQGLKIVKLRESQYRYPVSELSTIRPDHTSYHFGYLYPVHQLHFWKREEDQARHNKWKFWYENIWNVWRIIGIVD